MNRRVVLKYFASGLALPLLKSLSSSKSHPTKIHFVGLGDAGTNGLKYIQDQGVNGHWTYISNSKRPEFSENIKFIHFDSPRYYKQFRWEHFTDWAINVDISEKSKNWYKEQLLLPEEIQNILMKESRIVLLAGFGGYTGTTLMKSITNYLLQANKHFMSICTLPFAFEGKKQMKQQEVLGTNLSNHQILYAKI